MKVDQQTIDFTHVADTIVLVAIDGREIEVPRRLDVRRLAEGYGCPTFDDDDALRWYLWYLREWTP